MKERIYSDGMMDKQTPTRVQFPMFFFVLYHYPFQELLRECLCKSGPVDFP